MSVVKNSVETEDLEPLTHAKRPRVLSSKTEVDPSKEATNVRMIRPSVSNTNETSLSELSSTHESNIYTSQPERPQNANVILNLSPSFTFTHTHDPDHDSDDESGDLTLKPEAPGLSLRTNHSDCQSSLVPAAVRPFWWTNRVQANFRLPK
ncbi:hypothetical protein VKT23_006715 [Stygiomarasmius scandens]|uniref:Uncharacterized protein n=1 Tax=Marasmiellus scandens TaxID=2682957 RepID=A0ABR1IR13_9AGAR